MMLQSSGTGKGQVLFWTDQPFETLKTYHLNSLEERAGEEEEEYNAYKHLCFDCRVFQSKTCSETLHLVSTPTTLNSSRVNSRGTANELLIQLKWE